MPHSDDETDDEGFDRARRRLLKAGLYAVPWILTFGVFSSEASGQGRRGRGRPPRPGGGGASSCFPCLPFQCDPHDCFPNCHPNPF